MVFPTIGPHGTNKTNLLLDLRQASGALKKALSAMAHLAPQPRDYNGKDAFGSACAEHALRVEVVEKVRGEIEVIMDRVYFDGTPQ